MYSYECRMYKVRVALYMYTLHTMSVRCTLLAIACMSEARRASRAASVGALGEGSAITRRRIRYSAYTADGLNRMLSTVCVPSVASVAFGLVLEPTTTRRVSTSSSAL